MIKKNKKNINLFIIIFFVLSILILFFLYSCKSSQEQVTVKQNEVKKEEKIEEKSDKTQIANEEKKQEEGIEEKKEKSIKLINKEYEGVIFENVPENLDLADLKNELETFFLNYEQVVLSKNYDKWLTMISSSYYLRYNSLDYLKKINATSYGIYNIKQYFYKVVYESRIKLNNGKPLKIYKIIFKQNDLDRAIVLVKFENKILKYYFIKIDKEWKISTNDEYFQE